MMSCLKNATAMEPDGETLLHNKHFPSTLKYWRLKGCSGKAPSMIIRIVWLWLAALGEL